MPDANIYFGRPINPDTATNLVHAVRSLASERGESGMYLWPVIMLTISSSGGGVAPAFSILNDIKACGAEINTHNAGSVDSAAIIPFMAGKHRTASPLSGFYFHQLHWTFGAGEIPQSPIDNAVLWMDHYQQMMVQLVADGSKLDPDRIRDMMRTGALLSPKDALEAGLVHKIVDYKVDRNSRFWTV